MNPACLEPLERVAFRSFLLENNRRASPAIRSVNRSDPKPEEAISAAFPAQLIQHLMGFMHPLSESAEIRAHLYVTLPFLFAVSL